MLSILRAMLVHGMIIQGRSDDKHFGATAVDALHAKEIEYCKELGEELHILFSSLKNSV